MRSVKRNISQTTVDNEVINNDIDQILLNFP